MNLAYLSSSIQAWKRLLGALVVETYLELNCMNRYIYSRSVFAVEERIVDEEGDGDEVVGFDELEITEFMAATARWRYSVIPDPTNIF